MNKIPVHNMQQGKNLGSELNGLDSGSGTVDASEYHLISNVVKEVFIDYELNACISTGLVDTMC